MNVGHDLKNKHFFPIACALAESALRLRGEEAEAFIEQFCAQAATPVLARIAGDGKAYRQALCFPVAGAVPNTDAIKPFPGLPPHLLVELPSGHVIGFRLNDVMPLRLSLTAFMSSIERYLDLLTQRDSYRWSDIQHMIEGQQRQRTNLFNFVLEDDPDVFWREYFQQGATRLATQALHGIPFTDAGRRKVIAALFDIHTQHYRQICADFLGHLDTDRIKAILLSKLTPQISTYNSFKNSNANSIYRIQAAEAVPLLGYMLGVNDHRAERLRYLVDDGQPLWPALADTLHVPEETVRWLRNKTAEEVGDAWLGRIHKLLPDLAKLPPEKRPKTCDEWTAYTDFILVLNDLWSASANTKALWLSDLARLGWVQARQKFAAMNAAPSDLAEIGDFVHSLSRALCCELLPEEEDKRSAAIWEAVDKLFFESSILKQLRASLRWHELQLQPPEEEEATEESLNNRDLSNWPAPLPEPVKLGRLTAHFLITPAQLKDEGMRMQHCVGSYGYQCLYGGSTIVSFRDRLGRSISTVELLLADYGTRLRMKATQHKARNNAQPSPEAVDTLNQLLTRLNDEELQPRLQEMRKQLLLRQARDKQGEYWDTFAPNAPEQLRILKSALKLHVGYERFLEAGRKAMQP